ncbi:DNA-binding transcriptional LysR family regulator [Rhizobium sp. BK226]|uniref:LysR substrate-binding domain-containing protein n=1 Tax=Rhizobium TaxID=379 RepID=UPI000BE9EFB0|nr:MULTISPECIES: LysR substrate-binding domain-containing protein [Rhizobium]MBB4114343.1 DNA-binding transcriptional LysR family regulator [Rhizobium sp. BK226]NKM54027.1 LysR family transcriptional regulator [Rhizobium anhuiense]PDS36573.1 LysR family transcriptional regulator [Rhizobium anhuiense]PDS58728.1 LysR family transcriptional regulator [Rhizobium anhuiense]PDS65659.1 LysR family transcriptional regulator [Rhizobium anhuiense]
MALFNLNDLHLFVQAVDSGSFTAAARHLGIPKSTVSKRVAELEGRLGVRLIQRTSRSFALTELGREFFQHAQASMIEAEMAEGIVRRHLAEPAGSVRLTASVPTAQFTLTEHLPALAARYPKLRLSVHVTDRFVDIVQEGFDIALRSHRGPLPDSALVQRKLASHPFLILASPDYISKHGQPRRPEELAEHATIMTSLTENQWRLYTDHGDEALVSLQSVMAADEPYVLMETAAAGLGITCLPTSVCRKALADGRLVRVLPEWTAGSIETTILMPHRRGQLPAVRAVVDFLAEQLGG